MNCRRFAETVDEWIDGLLAPDEAEAARAHAAGCAACAAEADRARRFHALLQGPGREALVSVADRAAFAVAVAEATLPSPSPSTSQTAPRPAGRLVRLALPLAAAAALIAGIAVGRVTAGGSAADRTVASEGVDVPVARGARLVLAPGRTVVADEATVLQVEPGSAGERVRLASGAAVFQVEHGLPFTVATELGDAEVRGTLFHVERRANRSVGVSVMSGVVVFRPRNGGASRTLRAGASLDVAPDGAQTFVSRADQADLVMRLDMQTKEVEALRGDLARRDERIQELQALVDAGTAAAAAAVPSADEVAWDEVGAAMFRARGLRPDEPAFMEAMAPVMARATEIRDFTGSGDPRTWVFHPVFVSRTARGFVGALAPDAAPEARDRAVAAIRQAANECLAAAGPDPVPAEGLVARLRMHSANLATLRDQLGPDAARIFAEALRAGREGAGIRVFGAEAGHPGPDVDPASVAAMLAKRLDLTDGQKAQVQTLSERAVVENRAVQAEILRTWGDEAGNAFLFPKGFRFRPDAGAAEPPKDPDPVATEFRRIDAKIALLAPRVAFERDMRALLTADQRARWARFAEDPFVGVWR